MNKEFIQFLKHVKVGYLLFTSLIILGVVFGAFEIIERVIFTDLSESTLRWLFVTRGAIASLLLMVWAGWTVFKYRELYEEKLEVTESRYRDIIENSADAILSLNNERIITSWNRGAEEVFGWNRQEIIGEPVKKLIPEDLLEKGEMDYLDARIREDGHVRNYETERLNKKGKRILVHLTESPIRDERNQVVGRSQILRDLTELKVREQQIQHSERLAAVGHMAAGIAHEVGNPLTAISSLAQVSQRKTDNPFVQEQLKKIRTHIQRINKIVRDLVDFSRPSSLETENTKINYVIESAVGLLKHDARCREVEFNMELSNGIPGVKCVPDHIHQVMVNLLLNSVDAMEKVDEPRVTIQTGYEDGAVTIKVSDIGKGIEEEHLPHIFEPFFTTKEVGSGTGLGLSVSHGIIQQLDGTIDVESEPGAGTTFIIKLPTEKN